MNTVVKVLSAHEQIYSVLLWDIISGKLLPNAKINEAKLAKQFGVSTSPIRLVIQQMITEGLLTPRVNSAVYVVPALNKKCINLMMQLKKRIEKNAIKQIISDINYDDFLILKGIHTQLLRQHERSQLSEFILTEIEFFKRCIEFSGNGALVNIWLPMRIWMWTHDHKKDIIFPSLVPYDIIMADLNLLFHDGLQSSFA